MFTNVNRYLAVISIGIKQQLAYKLDIFFSLVFRVLASLIMIAVWSAVYLNSKTTTIGGFTLPAMYVYFFLVNAIAIMSFNEGIAESIENDVQSGTVTTSLIRPMSYPTQLLLNSIAGSVFAGVTVTLPVMIMVSFLTHLALSAQNILFFAAEVALSYAVSTILFFLVGSIAFYLINVWGMIAVTESVYFLLGGAIMPLNLLPAWLGNIFTLFPMQLALYVPAATLLGMLSTDAIIHSLVVGMIWMALLLVASKLWWRRASIRVSSAGG